MNLHIPNWVLLTIAGIALFGGGLIIGWYTTPEKEIVRRVQIMIERDIRLGRGG